MKMMDFARLYALKPISHEELEQDCEGILAPGRSVQSKEQHRLSLLADRLRLGILCLECGLPCYLLTISTKTHKKERWMCRRKEHNS